MKRFHFWSDINALAGALKSHYRLLFLFFALFFIGANQIAAHGDFHEVIERLDRQIEASPEDVLLHFERGLMHQEHGSLNFALADYLEVLRLEPGFHVCHLQMAQLYLERDMPVRAFLHISTYLEKEPGDPFGYQTRALIHQKMGGQLLAAEDLRTTISLKQMDALRPEDYLLLADGLLKAFPEDYNPALTALKDGVKQLGAVITLQSRLVELLVESGDCSAALEHIDDILKTLPRKTAWLQKKAAILKLDGRLQEAEQLHILIREQKQKASTHRIPTASPRRNATANFFRLTPSYSAAEVAVIRGPYLQMGTPSSVVIRWRTDVATDSKVWYGSDPNQFDRSVSISDLTEEHEVMINGLAADTRYYYAVGSESGVMAGATADHYFKTSPSPGAAKPFRAWILGDCGTGNDDARAVRDGFQRYAGNDPADMILLLGDNAYDDGKDSEYQKAMFENMYEAQLIQSILWPAPGNHDLRRASSADQTGPYFDIFTMPTKGEAGGLASGTEAYYSFDYGNVHFVSLDSHDSGREPGDPMLVWLENDLNATNQEWTVVFFHHPPYSKGSHDSDKETKLEDMRQNVLPILEAAGVDLVMSGHSHSYERSYLINGHYGRSKDLQPGMILDNGDGRPGSDGAYDKIPDGPNNGLGAVYAVAGSSGKITTGKPLNHPVMYYSAATLGSLSLEVNGSELDLKFIDVNGAVLDSFAMVKAPPEPVCSQVSHSSDDAEEASGGRVKLTSSDLELTEDPADAPQLIGLRFTGLDLSPGSSIRNATIQFTVDETKNTNPCNLTIYGQAVNNAPAFTKSDHDISSRSRTQAAVTWSPPEWSKAGEAGPAQQTVDISPIIQEIVSRNGFTANSAIALIIEGSGLRVAESFDGSSAGAPVLCIVPGPAAVTYDCPQRQANIGAPCDDGDPNTQGEVVQPDCSCSNLVLACAGIAADSDDAEESTTGQVRTGSSDLELIDDNTDEQTVGLRFSGLQIPQRALIVDAYVQFVTDETNNANPCQLTIYGEATDDATTFTSANANISTRERTNASVAWSPPDWENIGDAGPAQRTPDLTGIVQEIVDRAGYQPGNSLALFLEGAGRRVAVSFDGDNASAPVLCVRYDPTTLNFECLELQADIGTPCDDGDPCTTGDVVQDDCSCAGVYEDSDDDGVCDVEDVCEGMPDPGTPCDDGDPCTENDVVQEDCGCAGIYTDTDNDGLCDAEDECPAGPAPGTPCDDGDPCTINDMVQEDCGCAGNFADEDKDGICDAEDTCPGRPEPGMPCDDGDPDTDGETVQDDCSCQLVLYDCPEYQANIGDPCDDGDPDTEGDSIRENCACRGQVEICSRIAAGSDDAEEWSSGRVVTGSSDIELVHDNTRLQTAGLRFVELNIPSEAKIISATIQFTVDQTKNKDPCELTIYGEASLNPATFETIDQNISSRAKTGASVPWSPPEWLVVGEAGSDQRTPDIATIIQEIVNQEGYVAGNAMAILIEGTGMRIAEAYDGMSNMAPVLCIVYQPPFNCLDRQANIGDPCDDGDACTINDVVTEDCGCAGAYSDRDSDGVCDGDDRCPNGDDAIDTDQDGTPDVCDACPKSATDDSDGNGICDDLDHCDHPEHIEMGQTAMNSETYRAQETITSSGEVPAEVSVAFIAGSSISLKPGFHAKPESEFKALIEQCPEEKQTLTENRAQEIAVNGAPPLGHLSLTAYPNPFRNETIIEYRLGEETEVSLDVFSITGVRIKVLQQMQRLPAGVHQIRLNGAGLEPSLLLLRLRAGEEVVIHKLVLME